MEELIHRRLVANTSTLFQELKELGYTEDEPVGRGLNQTRIFYYQDRQVHVSHNSIILKRMVNKKLVNIFEGLTIHDEILKFFTKREILERSE